MNLESIVVRARDVAQLYRLVDYALTFDLVKAKGITTLPALIVMPLADTPQPNRLAAGAIHQETTWTWRAYIYVKSARQDLGKGAIDELTPVRASLFDAWLGWQPEGASGISEFAGGKVVAISSGVLVWQDDFRCKSYYRRVS